MYSSTLKPPPSPLPYSLLLPPSFPTSPNFMSPNQTIHRKSLPISTKCVQVSISKSIDRNPNFSLSCVRPPNVAEKLRYLVSEFRSLPEPIDRVKRLLQYANLLPHFDESGRVLSNRAMGCTAQVWLEVRMDSDGAIRFRVGSDSEITKGFCSCLIWLLDGAMPEEVLEVKKEDLVDINVGLPANSRVNTWHNVLISMQRRTKDLVEPFPILVDDINSRGSNNQAQV